MTHDEAMKLVGGYATNSLSDDERTALFAAALEDQELFDALENEQALKEVFDDRVARAEIRHALETPAAVLVSAWWTRWWAWGGAGAAVAVLALAAVWSTRQHQNPVVIAQAPKPTEARVEAPIANPATPAQARLKTNAPAPHSNPIVKVTREEAANTAVALAKDEPIKKEASGAFAPNVMPPPAPAGQRQNSLDAMKSQAQMEAKPRGQISLLASRAGLTSVNYTLLRRELDGRYSTVAPGEVRESDMIRVSVQPPFAGTLSVYLKRGGASTLIMPLLTVTPGRSYLVPDVPVAVKNGDALQLELNGNGGVPESVSILLGKP